MKYLFSWVAAMLACVSLPALASEQRIDHLSLAQGAIPVASGGAAEALKVGTDLALLAIDGDSRGFSLTPKPGAADTSIVLVFQLPALTTFTDFAVPNILETPSPSQTFIKSVAVAGSAQGPGGPFIELASVSLKTHTAKGQTTEFPATAKLPVRWVRLTLSGGISVMVEKTFFEFSEIIGYGQQEPVPLLKAFTSKWKGRGVLLELKQDGVRVSGCYDRVGDLSGTVSGNILRATGADRSSGVPSAFVLTVAEDGSLIGVSSTNQAPFRLYSGAADPKLVTECSERPPRPPGCGDIVHGIQFAYDSAAIGEDSAPVLDAMYQGLKDVPESKITIIGHTSSEGSDTYNRDLSQRRAAAVVTALTQRGIAAARLAAQGAGETQPIADNSTEAGRSLNRRVQIQCQ